MKSEKLLSSRESARLLGVNRQRIQVLISQGRLPAQKIGNSYVIRREDLQLVKNRPTGRPPKKSDNGLDKPKSFAEIAKDYIGSVDSGLGDLSVNKKYMEGYGLDG